MKILALDSSGLVASAAIVEDDVLIAEYTTDYKKTHSQTLLPMLDEIRQMICIPLMRLPFPQDLVLLPDFGSGRLRQRDWDWH